MDILLSSLQSSIQIRQQMLDDAGFIQSVKAAGEAMIASYRDGGKLLFCGNGGSAADAQHIAAELSGRFYKDRPPLDAQALHTNSSFLTAVANDYGYDQVFSRMVDAIGNKGDVLIAISTTGNSPNILQAITSAKSKGLTTVGLTGKTGGKMAGDCDYVIRIPSDDTPRIQECHILIGHIWSEMIEHTLFP